ncbi:hypothetical protein A3B85_00845 [Candidatus Nomurabacteria bacterium RIFCSPHIGHO2_02_FULL_37_13]|uniref:Uncharacterized protein n=1 Tax=Candidatus Nomurabacteria bacterium RIFCSPHIGHO2_02_FULL_37_13 TaxID=1801750 RepID=A0A1F6W5A9_9BACT|nr:MAG: hypothetical protein A2640_03210 [Candidatus Nomurabacteria bacterium RIFCSPHIGHO2_01_FULL_36_23]OGI77024.1 MAG: hypothetical protein A3B85_00845 [Candidatus Nomurabacteria bacterium RIFCSPHIGHO2_02_FULL_37_13]OGI88623.1 MAG: hypothetical protein A2906_03310 [Candidatus Nomurabacteria bacterium RIFCSPLOWO2_01_FULL_37_25]
MSQNKVKILVVLVVVLVIGLVFVLFKDKLKGIVNNNNYSVVYLTSGEVYIGKLTTVPDLQLKDIYALQITKDEKDPTKNGFQLQPLRDTLWTPKVLHLVKDSVVFYGPLSPDSKIAQTLTEQVK